LLTFAEFREDLQDLLSHLHDPAYTVSRETAEALKHASQLGEGTPQAVVIRAIRDLRPAPEIPPHAHAWRLYQVLSFRYLEQLTQQEAAERLGIVVRHLAREQVQAIQVLADHLWPTERFFGPARHSQNETNATAEVPSGRDPGATDERLLQIAREVACLHQHTSGAVVHVAEALQDAAKVAGVLAARRGVLLKLGSSEAAIVADTHPAVMGQVLVAAITYLLRGMAGGEVELSARKVDGQAKVTIVGAPVTASPPAVDWFGRELLESQGGSFSCCADGASLVLVISIPLARRTTVLVVDDNDDLVHFYRRCVEDSVYQMVNLAQGSHIFDAIAAAKPDLIVLDLMLPDTDGWELLAQLHEHPLSRPIPVVVCSVVQEDELALALGAAVCLAKPVQCRQFLEALDQALASRLQPGPA